jgi:hypothetical protein
MPQVAAQFVAAKVGTALVAAGVTGKTLFVISAAAYYGTQVAIAVAASAAAQKLAQASTPDPETAKASLKQAIPPRMHAVGRCRMGGSFLCWEASANYGYDVVATHDGRIEGVDQIWLFDKPLSFVGGEGVVGGWVVGTRDYGGGANDLIHVDFRLGAPTETAYAPHVAALGATGVWTEAHRCDGIATIGADYHHAKKENLLADFPNGLLLQWSQVARWAVIWDPRDPAQDRADDTTWPETSGNMALQILYFLWKAPGGMRLDFETEIAPALDHWIGEVEICDEPIAKKGGGTEPRYWGSGFWALPGDPQDTLDKMLAACDGRLLRDENGVWRLWVGKVRAPTVWLTDDDIADYDLQMDAAAFDVVNELVPTFVSEAHGWTAIEAAPQSDVVDIADRGQALSQPFPLEWCNSGAMAQRVAKRERLRQLTDLRGALICKLSAARAMGQRWIGLTLADLDLDEVVIEQQKGGKISFSSASVLLPFARVPAGMDDWDAETEEDAVDTPPRPDAGALSPPTLTSATPFVESLGGTDGVRLAIVGSGPDRDDLTWYVRWRLDGSESWSPTEVVDEQAGPGFEGVSGFVASGQLEVALGYETGGSSGIQWSDTEEVDTTLEDVVFDGNDPP